MKELIKKKNDLITRAEDVFNGATLIYNIIKNTNKEGG